MGGWVGERLEDLGKSVEKIVVDPIKDFGSSLEEAVRDAADDVNKVIENPYVQAAVSIWNPAAGAVLSSYATLNSGDELSEGQIIALAAAGINAADFSSLPPETVNEIKRAAQVATSDDPGRALVMTYGADVARASGATEAFDNAVANTLGQDALNVIQQNENYIIDSARLVTGDISEQELIAKYGAGAVDYATSGTALEDYNNFIADAINVGVGNTSIEEVVANRYGEDIVKFLGAETENERAIGLGGLTTATQIAMGMDPAQAALAGTKRAYDEGARLEDLSFIPENIANIDFGIGDFVANLGIDFPELRGRGYDLPSLASLGISLPSLSGIEVPELLSSFNLPEVADLGFDIPSLDLSGFKPVDLGYDVGSWGQLRDLGVNINDLDLSDYNLPDLANLNLDLQLPELDLFLRNQGITPLEYGSLDMDRDLLPEFNIAMAEEGEELPLSQQLLRARLT